MQVLKEITIKQIQELIPTHIVAENDNYTSWQCKQLQLKRKGALELHTWCLPMSAPISSSGDNHFFMEDFLTHISYIHGVQNLQMEIITTE